MDVLERTQVYDVRRTPDLIEALARELEIDPMTYEPIDTSGEGRLVTAEQELDVAEQHPLDVALYSWIRGRGGW